MQINENIYIDLEIPALSLKNFLQPTDCYGLEIVETAGVSMPTALMVIKTFDEKVVNGINENNELILHFGTTPSDCETFTIYPVMVRPTKGPDETCWTIEFGGFIYNRSYMVDQNSAAYENKTSLEVLTELWKKGEIKTIETDILSVKENKVTWRRTNQTMCQFLIDLILHMDIRPSFPLFGVSRDGRVLVRDFEKACKEPVKTTFVPYKPKKQDSIQYINNFNVLSYKSAYDLFAGFNRNVQITKSDTGEISNIMNPNVPVIASTQVSEQAHAGVTNTLNQVQSPNVHDTFTESFVYNTNKLVSLSSYVGELVIPAIVKNVYPSDIVYVLDGLDAVNSFSGLYIVDTISTSVGFSTGTVITKIYVTRDNKNNVENYIRPRRSLKIKIGFLQKLANAVSDIRIAYAQCKEFMDGTYLNKVLSFAVEAKNNLLRSFSIAGVTVDFTSQANLVRSLILVGNSLMNTLVDMVFPIEIANVLRDFIIRKPTLIGLIGNFVLEWVPSELQPFIMKLITSLFNVTDSLNSIARDNGVSVLESDRITGTEGAVISTDDTSEIDYTEGSQERVDEILSDLEDKTTGLDLPFPMIELSESQSLYSDADLRTYVINKTIENLTNLGYLNSEEDIEDLRKVLTGEDEIDFSLITRINNNAGNRFSYRFWGTFGSTKEALYSWRYEDSYVYTKTEEITARTRLYKGDYSPYAGIEFKVEEVDGEYRVTYNGNLTERDLTKDIITDALAELTSFKIRDSYKDKYRTIPCTKMISASDNQRIYFACPVRDSLDIAFYINTKRVKLDSFEIDLGYVDFYGNPIMYNVFYTNTGYNSNSVLFEVKKGGMV